MYENDFDSFVSQVLGGNNGLPVKSASQDQPAPQAMFSADQAEAAARAALSAEEAQMAEYLGQLEAENTVKQANFLQGLGGQQMNYGEYLVELEKSAAANGTIRQSSHVSPSALGAPAQAAGIYTGTDRIGNASGGGTTYYTKAERDAMRAAQNVGQTDAELARALAADAIAKRSPLNKSVRETAGLIGGAVDQHLIDLGARTGLLGLGAGGKAHRALGAGIYGAGALAIGGAGLGARRIAAARRAAVAPIEQSIGKKVLQHLAKHKVGYGVGAAGLAGLGALGAYKSASMDEMLWEKAASDGEAFLDQLASAALGDATTQELALFREAALSHINGY